MRTDQGPMQVLARGSLGGRMALRFLPAAILAPWLIGGLRLLGERSGLYGTELGVALFASSNIIIFALLIWWNARWLNRAEDDRIQVAEVLRRANAELEQRVQVRTAELEESAKALQAREEQFRAVAETAAEAIISADTSGRITYFNPAAESMFGRTAAEALGMPITVLMPERFRALHNGGWSRYLETGEPHVVGRTVELTGLRSDNSEFPLELSLAHWRTTVGTFFTAIIRDISERKQSEDQVRQINVQLAAANTELESFSYSVSHDLRAPLRSIAGFSEALLVDYREKLDGKGQDYLQRVRAAAHRMGGLIDDLLNLSRLNRQAIRKHRFNLSELASSIAAELRKANPERSVEFVIADGVMAHGDPGLLRVVMENLLRNAWKFTSKRDVARIEFGVVGDDEPAYFVRDNGAGFDMNYASKLFGAFQRLHGTTEYPGHGIGLATVQRIIQRHRGRVWAEAAVDAGATFFFTLPNSTGESDVPKNDPAGGRQPG